MTYRMRGLGAGESGSALGLGQLNARWSQMAPASPIALSLASLAAMDHALYLLHQSAHWQSSGPTYYGDHLMFQRLYKPIDKEIDSLGERAVGLGDPRLVCPLTTSQMAFDLLQGWGKGHRADAPLRLVQLSLYAEKCFLKAIKEAMSQPASDGAQNLLQGIADVHEGNVYLLQQRLVRG
jgi:DNA-binding ferritin-like protein